MLGKGENPSAGVPNVVLKLEYFSRGRLIGWFEGAKTSPPAQVSTAPTTPEVVVRSERTLGWFKVAGDSLTLLSEGETLVGKK